jgi:hypothetical protein
MRTVLLISSAALALAACQKTPAAKQADSVGGAPAATPTLTGGPPQRRAGLWEQTFSRDGQAMPMGAMRMCTDAASEAKASIFSHEVAAQHAHETGCGAPTISRGLDGSYNFSSTCTSTERGVVVTKGVAKGDFGGSYQVHVEIDTTGAPYAAMNGHHVMDVAGKWLGPCPAGMAPGDMQMSNGMSFHGGKLAGAAAAMGGAGQ